jgi:hypothetical protein
MLAEDIVCKTSSASSFTSIPARLPRFQPELPHSLGDFRAFSAPLWVFFSYALLQRMDVSTWGDKK